MRHASQAADPRRAPAGQRPLELILARNLLTHLTTPGFLVDAEATMVFFNEAAGALLGRSFEDTGQMRAEQWASTFGPLDAEGRPVEIERLALTEALRAGRPAHGEFRIRVASGESASIEASAVPIIASAEGTSGAMILFWSRGDAGGAP
ncbi:MAG TPA: hypothetical protein VK919_15090 [Solirubrobacterales bacterium]|nr:hypothetical protein [Solirubrobacterales bacterium]